MATNEQWSKAELINFSASLKSGKKTRKEQNITAFWNENDLKDLGNNFPGIALQFAMHFYETAIT